ncbi:cytochrome c [Sphingomonas sp. H39-1-10]|uniref:c-type cytochrome n=1 Tax=Sphingomonas pollutisoli TaxID=3030829 RepID=UPI0023B8A4EC|nr:cytochrome c [Sphingomonas pollutisoli]MDF0489298.1 cytochrome c [Sphingomonas pollutisoli]
MLKRLLLGAVVAIVVGISAFCVFAWRPAIAEIPQPARDSFAPALVARGEVLASAGYCASCHTAKGGKPFAGGYPMATQFGTIYSTNITPDPETGIGKWSEPAFRRAMHEGVSRNGAHLFPAFPYDHFTKLTDADVAALYAYFMTRTPVRQDASDNTVPFPLNIRLLQAGWKFLFFTPGRFRAEPAQSAAWNRGAYLAEGLSHCGACHTPRGMLGAEIKSRAFAGAPIDGWIAPPLDKTNPSPVPWTQAELVAYLSTGISRYHGTAAGPMGAVPRGLSHLPAADVGAIATYFASRNGSAGHDRRGEAAIAKAMAADKVGTGLTYDPAARLYTSACASCHYNGRQLNPLRPDLALNSAVNLDDPTNLIRVILYGVSARDGAPGVVMPGFARGFTDADVARIAAYLRATRTGKPAWSDLETKVATIRAQGQGQ